MLVSLRVDVPRREASGTLNTTSAWPLSTSGDDEGAGVAYSSPLACSYSSSTVVFVQLGA